MAQPGIGREKGVLRRIMQNIFNPKVHWRHLLTRQIKSSISHLQTWKRPHRRSHSLGFYIPAYKRDAIDVDIFVDTSGSISDREYNEFVAEIKGIMNSYPRVEGKVHYWNTNVYKSLISIRNLVRSRTSTTKCSQEVPDLYLLMSICSSRTECPTPLSFSRTAGWRVLIP